MLAAVYMERYIGHTDEGDCMGIITETDEQNIERRKLDALTFRPSSTAF